jgi:two-component system, OmpR family, sensor kinase
MTIRTKLILWYCSLLVAVIVLFAVGVFGVTRWTLISAIDNTLEETARQVIVNSRAIPISQFGGRESILVDLPSLDIFRASGVLVQVWVQVTSDEPRLASWSANLLDYRAPLDRRMLGSDSPHYTSVTINGSNLRVLTSPVPVTGQGRLFGNVQVAASLEAVTAAMDRLLGMMLISGGLATLGSIGIGMWLSDHTLKPINAITEAADQIATTNDLGTRLPWDGPMDELGRLISVFNRMLDRLEQLFSAQQRFVADVSHELRTPLTAVRGNLDLIRRYGMDPASLEAIESEVDRMSRMVNDLLLLARADSGGMTLDLMALDLDTVVTEVYREAQVLAKDRDLKVVMAHFEPVRIKGNPDRMKQLLLNLVSNAIKFTADGGQISLSLCQEDGEGIVTVTDTGIGIAPEDLEHVFDRFYQAELSRTRADVNSGSGLGLSIAKWIAEAHGGSLTVESQPGKGTTFTLTVPVMDYPTEPEGKEESTSRLDIVRRNRLVKRMRAHDDA